MAVMLMKEEGEIIDDSRVKDVRGVVQPSRHFEGIVILQGTLLPPIRGWGICPDGDLAAHD